MSELATMTTERFLIDGEQYEYDADEVKTCVVCGRQDHRDIDFCDCDKCGRAVCDECTTKDDVWDGVEYCSPACARQAEIDAADDRWTWEHRHD